jgi:hypothetical protein
MILTASDAQGVARIEEVEGVRGEDNLFVGGEEERRREEAPGVALVGREPLVKHGGVGFLEVVA